MSTALITAGFVFLFVAIMHLLRVIYRVKIVAGTKEIPLSLSILAFVISGALAVWMFLTVAQ